MNSQEITTLLASVNPAPGPATPKTPLDQRASHDLQRILATPVAARVEGRADRRWTLSRRSVPRRRLLIGAATLAITVAGIAVTLGDHGSPAYAATPAPLSYRRPATQIDAPAALRHLALIAQSSRQTTATGRYAYVETSSWSLFTRVTGGDSKSQVIPSRSRQWLATNGSGRIVRTSVQDGKQTTDDETYDPGGLSLQWPLGSLSSDPAELAQQLQVGHPIINGPAETMVAIADAYREMPIDPGVRSAMLRHLSSVPDVQLAGEVIDRAGRQGLAFSIDSSYSGLPTRYTLVFDPRTGRLLDMEEMLTTTAGKLNVPIPSVISYTLFIDAKYTDTLG